MEVKDDGFWGIASGQMLNQIKVGMERPRNAAKIIKAVGMNNGAAKLSEAGLSDGKNVRPHLVDARKLERGVVLLSARRPKKIGIFRLRVSGPGEWNRFPDAPRNSFEDDEEQEKGKAA